MGSSIVHWAASSANNRPGGKHFALRVKNVQILWFGVRGMKWEQFDSMLYSKLDANAAPNYLVVHLGSNDLGIVPGLELFNRIKCSFLRCAVARYHYYLVRHIASFVLAQCKKRI